MLRLTTKELVMFRFGFFALINFICSQNVSSSHASGGWRSTISSMWHKDAEKPDLKERGLPQQQLYEGHPGLVPPPTLQGDVLLVHEEQPATASAMRNTMKTRKPHKNWLLTPNSDVLTIMSIGDCLLTKFRRLSE
jgi:hypothetical protein